MADSGHPPAELHERLLICRTIKLNAGALGGHRRCCHAKIQKNAQNKPQIARLILCVHTTLQVYCNLFLTFCPAAKITFSLFLFTSYRKYGRPRRPTRLTPCGDPSFLILGTNKLSLRQGFTKGKNAWTRQRARFWATRRESLFSCFLLTSYFVPKIRSPASPRPGTI